MTTPPHISGDGGTIAGDGSTIHVRNHFHSGRPAARPAPADAATLAEARQLLDSMPAELLPPATLPLGSRMVLPPNRLFVGRDGALITLAARIKAGGAAVIGQSPVLTGWGGVGKTQLATELVWRYGRFFAGGVFWLSFADPAGIAAEIAACGPDLHLDADFTNLPLDTQVALVRARWQDGLPRLLVFDNCEDPDLFQAWCPPAGDCRVILTSRRATWPPESGIAALALGTLARADAITLLRRHRDSLDTASADAIAAELGDLPLALHLAGSYLHRYDDSAAAYLAAIRRPDLLDHASLTTGKTPTGHDGHVARSFALSTQKLDPATDALALAALAHAACFAPGEAIPFRLLALALGLDNASENDSHRLTDALHRLADLALIEPTKDGPRLHRLIAAFAAADAGTAVTAVETAVAQAAAAQNATALPGPVLPWQPHLRFLAEAAASRNSDAASRLLNELGTHLHMIADLAGAKAAFERALALGEANFGPDHPEVAIHVNNLGLVLRDFGDLAGAKAAFQRALATSEASFGPEHPDVSVYVNNLGDVLHALGDLAGAKAAFERALTIDEANFGPDHPKVATGVNNLGSVLQDLGDLAGAKAAFQRALTIDEANFGPDHPNVAIRVNNLGGVLRDFGDLAGAKAAFERALALGEANFGPDHPEVAIRVNNLGLVLQDFGDLAGAKAAFERALTIGEASFGPDHPKVATGVNNLGSVLQDLGDLAGAKAAFQRALTIDEANFGPDHPKVAIRVNNLGRVLQDFGDLAGAKAACERALAIVRRHFGEDHPHVRKIQGNLAVLIGAAHRGEE